MKPRLSIKIKAIVLTTIFLTNTLVGFACSIGITRAKSHHVEEKTASHIKHSHRSDTKPHSHHHTKAPDLGIKNKFTSILVQSSFAQNAKTSEVLSSYYSLKNALVNGDGELAISKATELTKAIEGADGKNIAIKDKEELLKYSKLIVSTKDIKSQRAYFSSLSNGMIAIAKSSKLSTDPIYVQYCPMKKSSWLSDQKDIKNPYYGSAMLTCGKVSEIIN